MNKRIARCICLVMVGLTILTLTIGAILVDPLNNLPPPLILMEGGS